MSLLYLDFFFLFRYDFKNQAQIRDTIKSYFKILHLFFKVAKNTKYYKKAKETKVNI